MSYDVTVRLRRAFRGVPKAVDIVGEQALFYGETIRSIPWAIVRYRKETIRNIAEMTMGTGALVMIGGTVGVAAFLTLASGGVIAAPDTSNAGAPTSFLVWDAGARCERLPPAGDTWSPDLSNLTRNMTHVRESAN